MHIVLVTRHIARAEFLYGAVLRAISDAETHLVIVGAAGTANAASPQRVPWHIREIAIRPRGYGKASLEWAVLAGDLIALVEERAVTHGGIDVIMSFERDLEKVVGMAARATQARVVVVAADAIPRPTIRQRARRTLKPMWKSLQQALPPSIQEDLGDQWAQWRDELRDYGKMVRRLAKEADPLAPLPASIRENTELTIEGLAEITRRLRQAARTPTTHYLLAEPPVGWVADAGWTDFGCGVGVDVEAFLKGGVGRTLADMHHRTMQVGVWLDPFGPTAIRERVNREAQLAVTQIGERVAHWVPLPEDLAAVSPSKARRYLSRLDVAIVPGQDVYAAMQAAAAGCLVFTRADSPAAAMFRDGESAACVAALDSVQIQMMLHRLRDVDKRAAMQDASQRRALRLFDSEIFIRCLARGIDANLDFGSDDVGAAHEGARPGLRRHI